MTAEKENGIRELLKVFNGRKDLQSAFPEAAEGDLSMLVAWALEFGTTIDGAKDLLIPFWKDFRDYKPKEHNYSFTWDNSVDHYIPDGFKIYWEMLDRVGSYQFECITGNWNIDMLTYTIDKVKQHFSGKKIRAGLIGCSELGRPEFVLNQTNMFSEIVVMDIARGLLDQQQKKASAENHNNIYYQPADFNEFVFVENEFDYINAWGTIHHVKNLEHFFSQAQKGLKKDGIMIIREYVGPTYLQYTDLQLTIVNFLLNLLPEELKLMQNRKDVKNTESRISIKKLMQLDPTESVRSGDILNVMKDYFEVVEFRKTGGTILHPLLNGIAGNFDKDPKGDKVLQGLIDIEKGLVNSGMLPSDFVYIVAKPSK
jgi:ubiquinone/menaquinone biosynthesis C-methylase UbiE